MKNTPFEKAINNSIRIARTEGHRIQNQATLDEKELDTLKERAEYFGLDKSDSFEEY